MKEQFVPYELALKLKQLGFDESCLAYWDDDKVFNLNEEYLKGTDMDSTWLTAPLFQQAFRWFRKQKFLIDLTSLNSDEYEFYIQWSFAYSFLSDIYKTYEEVELACLNKLIDIVELNKL
jgi:hypothetical protein